MDCCSKLNPFAMVFTSPIVIEISFSNNPPPLYPNLGIEYPFPLLIHIIFVNSPFASNNASISHLSDLSLFILPPTTSYVFCKCIFFLIVSSSISIL